MFKWHCTAELKAVMASDVEITGYVKAVTAAEAAETYEAVLIGLGLYEYTITSVWKSVIQ